MGRERVPIDKIIINRHPGAIPDDLSALEESMREGIQIRPLLNENYEVIDGARQLAVLKKWGHTEVDVVVSRELNFSLKVLTRRHQSGGLPAGVRKAITIRRVGELRMTLGSQVAERHAKSRNVIAKGGKSLVSGSFKDEIIAAIGYSNTTLYSRAIYLHRLSIESEDPQERALLSDLLDGHELGKVDSVYTIDGALRKYRQGKTRTQLAGNVSEQRAILDNAMNMLTGIRAALEPLVAFSPEHTPADIRRWQAAMRAFNDTALQLSKAMKGNLT